MQLSILSYIRSAASVGTLTSRNWNLPVEQGKHDGVFKVFERVLSRAGPDLGWPQGSGWDQFSCFPCMWRGFVGQRAQSCCGGIRSTSCKGNMASDCMFIHIVAYIYIHVSHLYLENLQNLHMCFIVKETKASILCVRLSEVTLSVKTYRWRGPLL